MTEQTFLNNGIDVVAFLSGPIASLSMRRLNDKRPDFIIFAAEDGTRLIIQSHIQDVSEDFEIGILTFSINEKKLENEVTLNLPPIFKAPRKIKKIVTYDDNVCFEVGFQLYTADFLPLVVLSGFSGRIAVFGCARGGFDCVPEFGIEHYKMVSWL